VRAQPAGPACGSSLRVQPAGPASGSSLRVQPSGPACRSRVRAQSAGPVCGSRVRVQPSGPTCAGPACGSRVRSILENHPLFRGRDATAARPNEKPHKLFNSRHHDSRRFAKNRLTILMRVKTRERVRGWKKGARAEFERQSEPPSLLSLPRNMCARFVVKSPGNPQKCGRARTSHFEKQ